MQGPHAFARTVPPAEENVSSVWELSRVARICSLPGVIKKSVFGLRPAAAACFTRPSARFMSWKELFVQLPINPADTERGHLFASTAAANLERGVERSGVNGPLICGSRVERLMII